MNFLRSIWSFASWPTINFRLAILLLIRLRIARLLLSSLLVVVAEDLGEIVTAAAVAAAEARAGSANYLGGLRLRLP